MKKTVSVLLIMSLIMSMMPICLIEASSEAEIGSIVEVGGWKYEIVSDNLALKTFDEYTRASDGNALGWEKVDINTIDSTVAPGTEMIHPSTIGGGSSVYTMRTFFPVEGGKTYYVKNLVYNNTGYHTYSEDDAGMSAMIATGAPVFGTLSGLTMYSHVNYGGFNSWSNETAPTIIGSKTSRVDKTATVGLNTFEAIITVPKNAENIMVSYGAWGSEELYYGEISIYEVSFDLNTEIEIGNVVNVDKWTYEIKSDNLAEKTFDDYTRASDGGRLNWTRVDMNSVSAILPEGIVMIHPSTIGGGNSAYAMRTFFPVEGGKTYYVKNLVYNNTGAATISEDNAGMSAIVATGAPVWGTFSGLTMYSHVDYGGFNSWSSESTANIIGTETSRVDKTATIGLNTFETIIYVPEDAENIMVSYGAWGSAELYYGNISIYEVDLVSEPIGGVCGDNVTWTLDDRGTFTVSGSGAMYDYGYWKNSKIYGMERPWEDYRTHIKKIVIEDGVTSIGIWSFYYCSNLTGVSIAGSVRNTGPAAFYNCGDLAEVEFNNGLEIIDNSCFAYCEDLNNVVIPNSVTLIDRYAFSSCWDLENITIGKNVKEIGYGAFDACIQLKNVYYVGSQQDWNKISVGDANNYLKNASIHYNTLSMDCYEEDGVVTIVPYNVGENSLIGLVQFKDGVAYPDIKKYDGTNPEFKIKSDSDKVKAFMWESFETMNPIFNYRVIK